MLLENLIHDQLNLIKSFFIAILSVLFLDLDHVTCNKSILTLVATSDSNSLGSYTTALIYLWVKLLNVDSILRYRLL